MYLKLLFLNCLFFLIIGLGEARAQTPYLIGEVKSTILSEMDKKMQEEPSIIKPLIKKEKEAEYIIYKKTKDNIGGWLEQTFRLNKNGLCDQIIWVYPISKWDKYFNYYSNSTGIGLKDKIWKEIGKNTWQLENGQVFKMIPNQNGYIFSIVVTDPFKS